MTAEAPRPSLLRKVLKISTIVALGLVLAVAGLLFLGLAPPGGHAPMLATSVAQSLPIQQGQSYTEARILLLAAGWNRSHALRQEECSAHTP